MSGFPAVPASSRLPLPSGTPADGQVPQVSQVSPLELEWASGGGSGTVTSVTAGDTSIVVGGTSAAPAIETGTLDVVAADHPPAANWSNNSHKITSLANGSGAQDAAAFGQIPTSAGTIGGVLAANNLSDVASASTALKNLGVSIQFFSGQPARTVQDGVTNATTTVTSATAAFTSADVGKVVVITGTADGDASAGNYFASTIASFTNTTTVVLTAAPTFSESSCNLVIGADNHTALAAFMTAITGGQGHIPAGVYISTGTLTVPGCTTVSGDGYDLSDLSVNTSPQKGTVLVFGGSGNPSAFITLGASGYTEGNTNPQLFGLAIDGSNLCQSAVLAQGSRTVIQNCQVQRGIYHALQNNGGSCWFFNNYIGQQNAGDVLYNSGSDVHIMGNILRQPGSGGACCRTINVIDFLFVGNHSFAGYNGVVSSSFPCNNLIIQNTTSALNMSNFCITGNIFDGVYGHSIVITSSGGGNARIAEAAITGNVFLAVSGFPATTYNVVYLDAQASSYIRGITVTGNVIRGVEATANNWEYLVGPSAGGGTIGQVTVMGNAGMGVGLPWPSTYRPDGGRNGNVFTATNTSGTGLLTTNDGQATFSGTGSQTAFTTNHLLAAAPVAVVVTPASSAAAILHYVTVSATQITITFSTAPAIGTNNVVIDWWASMLCARSR